ncbi:MAG TPA: regulatory protein RecX [Acidobacteriaceae bacterium]|jgi:regulatory protein|nr:regulatory protein RecX [Acidobacteriaceae bacterium]
MRSRNRKPAILEEPALYEYAVRLLGQQMRTIAEVKRLLRRRVELGEPGEAKMSAVIARLKEHRYLDDAAYAQDYARLRQENASLGRRRVQQDLMRKGVQSPLIAITLEATYENVDEEELARRHLERKRVAKPQNDKEAARVMRMLARAGFSTGIIYRILRRWEVPEEALTPLESMDSGGGESESES